MGEFPKEAETEQPHGEARGGLSNAIGYAVILLGLTVLGYTLHWAYGQLFPTPEEASLAVAAYFDPMDGEIEPESGAATAAERVAPAAEPGTGTPADLDGDRKKPAAPAAPKLKIEGRVQNKGQAIQTGQVKVEVRRLKSTTRERSNCCVQSILLDVESDGTFETTGAGAFRHFQPGDHLYITVEAWFEPKTFEGPLTEYIHLGGPPVIKPPIVRRGFLTFLFLTAAFGIWFLTAFTGPGSRRKNRAAIVLSYIVACTCLGIPLIAPVLLTFAVPDLQERLEDSPVGLVKTPIGDDVVPQWALTIGFAKSEQDTAEVEGMQGGLVIPFYVLILSILGGAINMTRQVPRYHRVGAAESPNLLESLFRSVREESPEKPEVTLEWRRGLVSDLMALLSAPVLAIATYYLLLWLELVQVPILVLVSFSVGLISEKILAAIKSLATKIVGAKTEQTTPGEAASGQTAAVQMTPAKS